jgi:hypothetical protein
VRGRVGRWGRGACRASRAASFAAQEADWKGHELGDGGVLHPPAARRPQWVIMRG